MTTTQRFAISHLIISCLLLQSQLAWSAPQDGWDRMIAELDAEAEALTALFDRDAILDQADYDADALVQFAETDIALEIYPGSLRGVDASIAGRSGNALDQSMLLATLLKDAGYEAQIAAADLNTEQAEGLIGCMDMSSPSAEVIPTGSLWLDEQRAKVRKHFQADTRIDDSAMAVQRTVSGLLPEQALTKAAQAMNQTLRRAASRYHWVRFRNGSNDAWGNAHPACPAAEAWALKPDQVIADAIDPADLQQLSVSVHLTDAAGNSHRVAGPWSRPTANLFNAPLQLEIVSDASLQTENLGSAEALTNASRYFFVRLNDQILPGSSLFDLTGRLLPMDAVQGLNTIFSTIAGSTEAAAAALGTLGQSSGKAAKAQALLQRVWVEIALEAPGVQTTTTSRDLFNPGMVKRGQAPKEALALAMVQRWEWAVDTTVPIAPWFQLQKNRALREAIVDWQKLSGTLEREEAKASKDESALQEAAIELIPDPAAARLAELRTMFSRFPVSQGLLQYPHRPNVTAVRTGLTTRKGSLRLYEMTDIIENATLSFRTSNGRAVAAPSANLLRGIWQTYAEKLDLTPAAEGGVEQSAWDQLQSVSRWTTRAPEGTDGDWLLQPDTANGTQHWWQIDAHTGSAIGMADLGAGAAGSAMTDEAIMNWIALGISAAFFVVGTAVCASGGGGISCCIYTNGFLALGGLSLSYLIGVAAIGAGLGWGVGVASSITLDLGATAVSYRC